MIIKPMMMLKKNRLPRRRNAFPTGASLVRMPVNRIAQNDCVPRIASELLVAYAMVKHVAVQNIYSYSRMFALRTTLDYVE